MGANEENHGGGVSGERSGAGVAEGGYRGEFPALMGCCALAVLWILWHRKAFHVPFQVIYSRESVLLHSLNTSILCLFYIVVAS